jgi:Carboxypeptidase regulatory-like domain
MKGRSRSRMARWTGTALAFVLVVTRLAQAQNVTTGSFSGVVTDPQGAVLPGVTVSAVHVPTGTRSEAVTGPEGHFEMPNVRAGGPYTITATLSGFRDQVENNVFAALGQDQTVNFKLSLAAVSETVIVTGQTPAIDTSRAGTAANIPLETVQDLPTILRSVTDVARTSPYFNAQTFGGATGSGTPPLSVAGRNNRYNSEQIDGAVNNDLFGLAASGTPGGQTGTQPISYDAIQEIQLVVAPYDVRQGGFSGGGINIITKSGANDFLGTGYYFAQNQNLLGQIPGVATPANPSPADTAVGTFTSKQGGFSVGGPIVKNTAFFFGNVDLGRQNTPSGFSLDGTSGGQQWNPADQATALQALSIIQNQYGFNAGGPSEFSKPTNSNKVFLRGDVNLSPNNQLMVRANYVKGLTDVGTPNNTTYYLPDNYYQIQDTTISSVAELRSTLSNTMFNEARVTYQRERNIRGDQAGFSPFPLVRVDMPDSNYILLGTDNSSTANKLNQDIVEVNDDITWLKGKHSITVGTHNEFFQFYNLFIQNLYGNYEFSSIANLQAGLAQAYSHYFSNTSNPLQAAQFSVAQYGVYAGDQWRVASNFTLTYGARFEKPHFPDTPDANPLSVTDFGYRTDIVPAPKMFSPRVGFNWDLSHDTDNRSQLRGGLGSFAGRTPYVWLSDQYGNTGIDFTQLSATFNANNKIPFIANPNAQPTSVVGGAAGNQTINLVSPNYEYPQVLRGNLAYDHALPWGLIGTAEFLYTKNLEDIAYSNLNYVPTGTLPDGRLTYSKAFSNLNNVILLSNTTQGSSSTTALTVRRPFKSGFFVSGSYSYNRAMSINDGTSSVAASNWSGTPVGDNVNNPPLSTSQYQAGNRVTVSTAIPIPLWHEFRSTASFYYNGQQGQPYVVLFSSDVNGDGVKSNDILYVPSSASQINVTNGTYAQLQSFINGDCSLAPYAGQIAPRNGCTSPWTNTLDFRYSVTLPTGGRTKVEATMDVFNLLNLFNKNWGWVYYPNFNSPTEIAYGGLVGGKETYNLSTITSSSFAGVFTRDDLASRWQAQWGLRFRF